MSKDIEQLTKTNTGLFKEDSQECYPGDCEPDCCIPSGSPDCEPQYDCSPDMSDSYVANNNESLKP